MAMACGMPWPLQFLRRLKRLKLGGLHQFEGLGQRFVWRGALGSTSGDRGSLCLEADQEGPLPQQESDEGLSQHVKTDI